MSGGNTNFALDLDLLEKEIEAKEIERRNKSYPELSGQISGSTSTNNSSRPRACMGPPDSNETDFNTLDEPVWDTINRDLGQVTAKFAQVLVPTPDKKNVLRDWDLWGPLFVCVALSLILQGGLSASGPQFTQVFSLAFFGSCVVTLNIKLLGGKISFFQTLCVIGYCLLPSVFAALASKIVLVFFDRSTSFALLLRLVSAGLGFLWSTYASMSFLANTHQENRKLLGFYPMILFYFVVSWLVVSNS